MEQNGICLPVGAGADALESALSSAQYDLYDGNGNRYNLLDPAGSRWEGLPENLDVPGSYPARFIPGALPEWFPLGLPVSRVPIHVVGPDKPFLHGAEDWGGCAKITFFSQITGADAMRLLYAVDDGEWNDAAALADSELNEYGAKVGPLEPERTYRFRLEVEGGPMAGVSNTLRYLNYEELYPDTGGDQDGGDLSDQGEDLPPAVVVPPPQTSGGEGEPASKPVHSGKIGRIERSGSGAMLRPRAANSGSEVPDAAMMEDPMTPGAASLSPEASGPAASSVPPGRQAKPDADNAAQAEPIPTGAGSIEAAATGDAPTGDASTEAGSGEGSSMQGASAAGGAMQDAAKAPAPPVQRPSPWLPAIAAGLAGLAVLCLCLRRAQSGKARAALLLAAAAAGTAAVLLCCYRFDNKYTRPRPTAENGVTYLDMAWYDGHPMFYLADGWTLYRGALLSPDELAGRAPDASLYLGRYGMLNPGDADAAPHGQATYRAVIATDETEREYALELPPVFTKWRLWVNGDLRQSVGYGEPLPAPADGLITFRAAGPIELVAAVEGSPRGFYSGYPPAFGSPRLVGRAASLRLIVHSAACALALLCCVLCLVAGGVLRFARPYRALALLCLCFCGVAAWPVAQAFGLAWGGSPGQRLCAYGVYLALVWIQGRMCALPGKLYLPACGAGALVCGAVLAQPLLVLGAGGLTAFSLLLGAYKWLTAAWLLATGVWALHRGRRYSAALLAGNVLFAVVLVMDRLLTMYEPVVTGWFPELAGAALVALICGVAVYDTVRLYREDGALRMELAVREETRGCSKPMCAKHGSGCTKAAGSLRC